MKFKSVAVPFPAKGQTGFGPILVQPNQAMTLQEILERFTRNESLDIGKMTAYDEMSDDDLGKLKFMDLVDQEEFIQRQKEIVRRYQDQEKRREESERKAAQEKILAEEREKVAIAARREALASKTAE